MPAPSKMNQDEFNALMEKLDKLFYTFDYMSTTDEGEREIRCFFSRIRKDIKSLENYGLNAGEGTPVTK